MPLFTTNKHNLGQLGRPSNRPILSRKEAREIADRYIRNNELSGLALTVTQALSLFGVMTYEQLKIVVKVSNRTLLRFHKKHLIDKFNIPVLPEKIAGKSVYKLGIVGEEIARWWRWISQTKRGYDLRKTIHDLLSNEVCSSLISEASTRGFDFEWSGAYESRLRNEEGRVVIEPDAVLKLGGATQSVYAIEYHNEDYRGRVADKTERYEKLFHSQLWRRRWSEESMPTILICYTHKIILDGYIATLKKMGQAQVRCQYLGKSIRNVTSNPDEISQWVDINHKAFNNQWQTVDLFAGLSFRPSLKE